MTAPKGSPPSKKGRTDIDPATLKNYFLHTDCNAPRGVDARLVLGRGAVPASRIDQARWNLNSVLADTGVAKRWTDRIRHCVDRPDVELVGKDRERLNSILAEAGLSGYRADRIREYADRLAVEHAREQTVAAAQRLVKLMARAHREPRTEGFQ